MSAFSLDDLCTLVWFSLVASHLSKSLNMGCKRRLGGWLTIGLIRYLRILALQKTISLLYPINGLLIAGQTKLRMNGHVIPCICP